MIHGNTGVGVGSTLNASWYVGTAGTALQAHNSSLLVNISTAQIYCYSWLHLPSTLTGHPREKCQMSPDSLTPPLTTFTKVSLSKYTHLEQLTHWYLAVDIASGFYKTFVVSCFKTPQYSVDYPTLFIASKFVLLQRVYASFTQAWYRQVRWYKMDLTSCH